MEVKPALDDMSYEPMVVAEEPPQPEPEPVPQPQPQPQPQVSATAIAQAEPFIDVRIVPFEVALEKGSEFLLQRFDTQPRPLVHRIGTKLGAVPKYQIFRHPDTPGFVADVILDKWHVVGAIAPNKRVAQDLAALNLINKLQTEIKVIELLEDGKAEKVVVTRELFDEKNIFPEIIEDVELYKLLRNVVWESIEKNTYARDIDDPVLDIEAGVASPSLVLNNHCQLQSESLPVFYHFTHPGYPSYAVACSYEGIPWIGPFMQSKTLAKNALIRMILRRLITEDRLKVSNRLKRRIHSQSSLSKAVIPTKKVKQQTSVANMLNGVATKKRIDPPNFEIVDAPEGGFIGIVTMENRTASGDPQPTKKAAKQHAAQRLMTVLMAEGEIDQFDLRVLPGYIYDGGQPKPAPPLDTSGYYEGLPQSMQNSFVAESSFAEESDLSYAVQESHIPVEDDLGEDDDNYGESLYEIIQDLVYDYALGSHDSFTSLFEDISSTVAGIAIMDSNKHDVALVSWAMGSGVNTTKKDSRLRDCYPEVLCRRGLNLFLANELGCCIQGMDSIFQKDDLLIRLKPELSFHLFMSDLPSGSATKYATEGKLSGEPIYFSDPAATASVGKNPEFAVTYKPASHSVSSSEKILKWNICGVQNAVLSSLIEPVYLSSIVLEGSFSASRMAEILCHRIGSAVSRLPDPYTNNCPPIVTLPKVKLPFAHDQPASRKVTLNWNIVNADVEVVDSETGLTIAGERSRLCNAALTEQFGQLLNGAVASKDYRDVSDVLKATFHENGYGTWKPN